MIGVMDFQEAFSAIKAGFAARRRGWNGKDQFVIMDNFSTRGFVRGPEALFPVQPTLAIKNQQDQWVIGWLPSMGDLFAMDWEQIENPIKTEADNART